MESLLDIFKIKDKESHELTIDTLKNGINFTGTNLWILIFAIFIASLGLNVNSTAVIIGAMLISPLMGPIMGIGLGMGINDLALIRTSGFNYLKAVLVGLATSTIYFLITPLNAAHSEILSRVSPSIYDVLIAFFGGLAGIMATSTKQKGNVIPGVAIATALMPPLCTAGYGLANLKFDYFFGAFYLFLINTVFIALATLIIVRFLKFPLSHLADPKAEKRAQRIMIIIVVCTILPSIYFGYDIVSRNAFSDNADKFIDAEAQFHDNYLLNKKLDVKSKTIELTYVGKTISDSAIDALRKKMKYYKLKNTKLEIHQGLAYLSEKAANHEDERLNNLTRALGVKDSELLSLRSENDTIHSHEHKGIQIFKEMKALYPDITNGFVYLGPGENKTSKQGILPYVAIESKKNISNTEKQRMENWLKTRFAVDSVEIIIEDIHPLNTKKYSRHKPRR